MRTCAMRTVSALLLTAAMLTACRSGGADDFYTSSRTGESTVTSPLSSEVSGEISSEATVSGEVPSPEPPVSGAWRWDPHIFDLLSGEYQHSAELLADAILGYRASVTLDEGQAQTVCDNFAFEFPPAALVELQVQDDTVRIDYLYDQTAHQKKLDAFEAAVENALNSTVTSEDSESVRALLLYEYVVNNVRYFTVDYTDKEITAFSALTEGVTICYGYADAFGYLLRQTGMTAHLYRGSRSDGAVHGWTYASVDGKWYHFDPTWDCSNQKNSGVSGLYYFGMPDRRRFGSLVKEVDCGFGALEAAGDVDGAEGELIPRDLYPCNAWSFDRESGELTCKQGVYRLY